jgi:DNA polymerase kappa
MHGLTAEACVQEMRKAVHAETQLSVSAGIAPNKVRATSLGKASNN